MNRVAWTTLLVAVVASAQPTPLEFSVIGREQGLSGRSVTAVAVDSTGFAWLGTDGMIDRFDGHRVRSAAPSGSFGKTFVRAAEVTADGAVWVGNGSGLWRRPASGDDFVPVDLIPGREVDVRALLVAADTLWVGTEAGVFRFVGRSPLSPASRFLKTENVRALARLEDGGVAVATGRGVSWLTPDRVVRHDASITDATALVESEGTLWVGRASGEVVALSPRRSARASTRNVAVSALEASTVWPGHVWVGYRGGGLLLLDTRAMRFRPLPRTLGLPPAFESSEVLSLKEGRGPLWGGGLDGVYVSAVGPRRFSSVRTEPDGPLSGGAVSSVHVSPNDPDVVWAGTTGGGLHRIDRGAGLTARWFDPGHPLAVIFSVTEDETGRLWLGGRGPVLWRFEPGAGAPRPFPLAPSSAGVVNDVVSSNWHPGHLWVLTSDVGLVRFDIQAARVVATYSDAPAGRRIGAMDIWGAVELGDTLWVASDGDGLWWLDLPSGRAGRFRPPSPTCLVEDGLLALAAAPDGALWLGGHEGRLLRIDTEDQTCSEYTESDGLPDEPMAALFVDASGHVWASTNLGLLRLDVSARAVTRFTETDGLPTTQFYWYSRDEGTTGDIAVGGTGGLTVFDPLAVRVDDRPSPVVLTGLRVDGEARPAGTGGVVDLPHDENDVTFEYASLDFRGLGRTRYRVRLREASETWEPAGPETRFRALAPGRYTFEVAATNRDGYWSPPLSVPFRIRPPYWQTLPFWALVIAALGAAGYATYRYRLAQIQRVERTRQRIADDLHDGIGSKISSVALRLDMVGWTAGLPESARGALSELAGTARGVVDDLRDTVWLVDADHDDLASLVTRMELFAENILGGLGTVDAPTDLPHTPLTMETRRNLYLLFTEAVHNAVRHAGASRVGVRIEAAGGRVGFVVEDDGSGFDFDTAPAGRGLTTMRRRAAALGGQVTWAATPGGGTVVHFSADLR